MSRFHEINRQLKTLRDAGLTDSPTYERLLSMSLEAAPDSVKDEILNLAITEGLIPPPIGVDKNGQRLWRLEDIAQSFGLSDEEIQLSLAEFQKEHGDIPLIDTIQRFH